MHANITQAETTGTSAPANEAVTTSEVSEYRPLLRIPLQTKLTVGSVDDPLEHEADAMADQVMRMPENNFIQRKCAHCAEEEKLQRQPLASFIQRKENAGTAVASDTVSSEIHATAGAGNSFSGPEKTFMESRFGADFSGVRIRTGTYAAQLSNQLNAQAFTVGNDIYFNNGKFQPQSESGKHLLAHELTHTIQQGSGNIQRRIQRTVDNVEINCGDNQIRFSHDGEVTSYALDHCDVSDGQYDAAVRLSTNRVDFDLGTVPENTHFDFHYSIAPGQANPNSFFRGQNRVNIVCTHTPGVGLPGDIRFNVRRISNEDFLAMTGNSVDTIPEGIMVPVSNFLGRSLGPAGAGASYFSPTTMSFVPRNVTGVLWTQGHTSLFATPEGAFSPTLRGYRGNLGYYTAEAAFGNSWIGQQCTIRLNEGVPGSFANDAWFPMMPGNKDFIFVPRTAEQAANFADALRAREYGGNYTYSPPRSAADPILGPVGTREANLNAELTARGNAPMCTNNCITVPQAEVEAAIGGRLTTPSGVDVMSGTGPDGVVDPHYAGRGRLMTDAMTEGPLPAGATRMRITVTPGGSASMFVIRGGGYVMLVYGIYQTGSRIANTDPHDLPVVLSEEAGSWTGGILGSALGGAAAGAIFCAPTGPVDAVCVVGGFLGGLLFGIAGSAGGQAVGHAVGEHVVQPIVDRVNEVEADWTRGIYNLYGVPHF